MLTNVVAVEHTVVVYLEPRVTKQDTSRDCACLKEVALRVTLPTCNTINRDTADGIAFETS